MEEGKKYIVYHGDAHYPMANEFTEFEEAKEEWENLKEYREKRGAKMRYRGDPDYLAVVIDEIPLEEKYRWEH